MGTNYISLTLTGPDDSAGTCGFCSYFRRQRMLTQRFSGDIGRVAARTKCTHATPLSGEWQDTTG